MGLREVQRQWGICQRGCRCPDDQSRRISLGVQPWAHRPMPPPGLWERDIEQRRCLTVVSLCREMCSGFCARALSLPNLARSPPLGCMAILRSDTLGHLLAQGEPFGFPPRGTRLPVLGSSRPADVSFCATLLGSLTVRAATFISVASPQRVTGSRWYPARCLRCSRSLLGRSAGRKRCGETHGGEVAIRR